MENLDRLGWTAGFAFKAHGATVGVRTNDASILERVREALPPGSTVSNDEIVHDLYSIWVANASGTNRKRREFNLLYDGTTRILRTQRLDDVFLLLENLLTLAVGYSASDDRVFVHAGAVGWQGKAIVLPGRSHAGKTTLVRALVDAGAILYSDEMAIIDDRGYLHPFPAALTVRENGTQRRVPVEDLGVPIGTEPIPVKLVVLSQYKEDAEWRPRTISPARAVMALLDNTVSARRNPAAYLPILRTVTTSASTIRSKRGEAASVVPSLLKRVAVVPG